MSQFFTSRDIAHRHEDDLPEHAQIWIAGMIAEDHRAFAFLLSQRRDEQVFRNLDLGRTKHWLELRNDFTGDDMPAFDRDDLIFWNRSSREKPASFDRTLLHRRLRREIRKRVHDYTPAQKGNAEKVKAQGGRILLAAVSIAKIRASFKDSRKEPTFYTGRMNPLPKGLVFGVVGLWIGSAVLQLLLADSQATRGQIGDMFGAVNALFSGLAFVAIYASLRAQHQESVEQQRQFAKQTALAALTAYAEITKSMWLQNVDQFRSVPANANNLEAMEKRYAEMMEARDALKRILDRGDLLSPSTSARSTSL